MLPHVRTTPHHTTPPRPTPPHPTPLHSTPPHPIPSHRTTPPRRRRRNHHNHHHHQSTEVQGLAQRWSTQFLLFPAGAMMGARDDGDGTAPAPPLLKNTEEGQGRGGTSTTRQGDRSPPALQTGESVPGGSRPPCLGPAAHRGPACRRRAHWTDSGGGFALALRYAEGCRSAQDLVVMFSRSRRRRNSWSYSSLQQTAKQTIDIQVPRTRGDQGGLQGFHPRPSSTASVPEKIVDIPAGGSLQGFLLDPKLAASSAVSRDDLGKGVFRTFPRGKKCPCRPAGG